MNKNIYDIVAFDASGKVIHSERHNTKAKANQTAREFLPYVNVFTVDIILNGRNIARYVKLSPNSGIVIVDGKTRNIRF